MRYGFCLVFSGRPDEGLTELEIAEKLDPTAPRIKKNIGNAFYVKREFGKAIEQCQNAINPEPSYPYAHELIASAYRAVGNYSNAIDEFEKYEILVGKDRAQARKDCDDIHRAHAQGGSTCPTGRPVQFRRRSAELARCLT